MNPVHFSVKQIRLELRFAQPPRTIAPVATSRMHWIDRIPLFWRLNLAGWAAFLLPEILLGYGTQGEISRAILFTCAQLPIQLVNTAFLRSVYHRIGTNRAFGIPNAAWMVFLCLLLAVFQVAILQLAISRGSHPRWSAQEEWMIRTVFAWLVYIGWSLFYFWLKTERAAVRESRRAERASIEAERMELHLLRAQLDPHFLFNGLNGIAAEIGPHPDHALEMVRELAGYLRYSLEHRHTEVTPLSEELDALKGYLRIEQARFGDSLRPSIEAGDDVRQRCIPSFLLQPIVENAVKHSRPGEDRLRIVQVKATAQENTLLIEVDNTGDEVTNWQSSPGVGLQTLIRRLELHYPDRHKFTLSHAHDMVCAKLELQGEPCSR